MECLDDGRLRVGRDLDEIQTSTPGTRKGVLGRHDPELCSVFGDHTYRANPDLLVYS